MNLFENLHIMKENENVNLTDKQKAVINIVNDDIDGYEGGSKLFKYSYNVSDYQDALNYIKDVMELSDSELKQAIDKEIRNISLSHEYENVKNESKYNSNVTTTSELYSKIQKLLRDALLDEDNISLNDLFNCYSINDLLDLYDFLSSEYDVEKYNSNINSKSQLWNEFKKLLLDDLQEPENREKVSLDEICNCFSFEKIKELYDYLSSEYQDNWDKDDEDLEEATSGIGGAYTTQAIDIAPKAFNKILKTTKENLKFDSQVDYNTLSDYNIEFFENGAGDYKVITPDGDKLDIDIELSHDDKYFVSLPSEDVRSVNRDLTTAIIDVINKLYNFPINEGLKKINENLYDEYLERIMDEKNNSNLVKLLNEIKDNKGLKDDDKRKLKKEIKDKFKTLKIEAVTKFYDKEFNDDVIKDKIEFTKSHPQEFMALKYADPLEYEGITYYIISEGKEINYNDNLCEVYLLADENLNKYLGYFKVIIQELGDAENGPHIEKDVSDVPYKIVSI